MKTNSKRIKGNVEIDVKAIKGMAIFNTTVIILLLVGIGVGVYFIASFIVDQINTLNSIKNAMHA